MDNKVLRRQKLRFRIRKNVSGTAVRPRLSVFRSNKAIYAQLIDDATGVTIASASSTTKGFSASGSKVEIAKAVGAAIGQAAVAKGVTECIFDRSGYLYHGRVKSLADGARESGLQF